MYDKYRTLTIFEIENGWLVRNENPDIPNKINQVSFISTYCQDKEKLIEWMKKNL